MDCCRVCMFLVNIMAALTNLLLLVIAVISLSTHQDVSVMIGSRNFLLVIAILFITSVCVVLTSIFGFCAALKNSIVLLKVFIVVLSVLGVMLLVISTVCVISTIEAGSQTENWLFQSLKMYGKDPNVKIAWDDYQKESECCGVKNKDDYNEANRYPKSCYKTENSTQEKDVFTEGCWPRVTSDIMDCMIFLGIVTAVAIIFHLIHLAMAGRTLHMLQKEMETDEN